MQLKREVLQSARLIGLLLQLLDIAAHELRTPIQPILGLTDILRSNKRMDRAAQEELLDIIVRNAKRLQRLADDILDVTKKRAIHIRDGGIEKEVLNVERQ